MPTNMNSIHAHPGPCSWTYVPRLGAQVHVLLDPDPDLNPLVYVVGVLDGGCGDTWEEQCQNRYSYNERKKTLKTKTAHK